MSVSGYKVRTSIYACVGDTSLHVYASPGNGDRVAWFKGPDGNTFAVEE